MDTIPSYQLSIGDEVVLREKSRNTQIFKETFENNSLNVLPYIHKEVESFKATFSRKPLREEIPIVINDNLIVEFYSK